MVSGFPMGFSGFSIAFSNISVMLFNPLNGIIMRSIINKNYSIWRCSLCENALEKISQKALAVEINDDDADFWRFLHTNVILRVKVGFFKCFRYNCRA